MAITWLTSCTRPKDHKSSDTRDNPPSRRSLRNALAFPKLRKRTTRDDHQYIKSTQSPESPSEDEAPRVVEPKQQADPSQAQPQLRSGVENKNVSGPGLEPRERRSSRTTKPEERPLQCLKEDEVHGIYSGAPHFAMVEERGRPRPSISFPWDFELDIRDVSDGPPLSHPAYALATLSQHLTMAGIKSGPNSGVVGYDIGAAEVPNMLHLQGTEPGTVGLEYFLQLPLADSLDEGEGEDDGPTASHESWENQELLRYNPEKLGLRKFDLTIVADRLSELGNMSREFKADGGQSNILDRQSPSELYTRLFGPLLTPPGFDSSTEDPTGLKVQIEALIKALLIKGIWYDFSSVEWRIRLGQLLWLSDTEDPESPGSSRGEEMMTDRELLLLQITIACELLVRLDAVAGMSVEDVKEKLHLASEEVTKFHKMQSRKVRWDLVLARRFLDNLRVKVKPKVQEQPPLSKAKGFLSVLSSATKPVHPYEDSQPEILFLPENQDQQLEGLFQFGEAISWPEIGPFETSLKERIRTANTTDPAESLSIYLTPLSSPRSVMADGSDYFSSKSRPQLTSRATTQRSFQLQASSPPPEEQTGSSRLGQATLIGGWLTRSYLAGLVLPGEAISHLLMSTLLENDSVAISTLGESASLYGGFIYQGRSWWSKSCIVGRVLSCLRGSKESMGWINVPCAAVGLKNGWLDVVGEPIKVGTKPRIRQVEEIAKDGSLLGDKDLSNTAAGDYVVPIDAPRKPTSTLWFDGLRLQQLSQPQAALQDDEPLAPTHAATLSFSSSSISSEIGTPKIPLRFDAYFISAWPCTPPPPEKLRSLFASAGEKTEIPRAHPLPASYGFTVKPAAAVLAKGFEFSPSAADAGKDVLVLDARGDAILELVARAWCAGQGEHAVVSRVGTTCLGCSVREARAAGVRVVIRVG